MNQQRPPWQSEQATYQHPSTRNPPAKASAPGNVQHLYNPNQYLPNQQMPSNGSYQLPPAMPPSKDAFNWDENVNSYSNYQQNHITVPQNHPSAPQSQALPLFNVPDYSLNHQVPSYPPEAATNNNQFEHSSASSDNWGWNDAGDWGTGWNNEQPQQPEQIETQQHQPTSQPLGQQVEPTRNFNPGSMPPVPATGLEQGLNAMSLAEQPPFPQYQTDVTSSWSRAPTGWTSTEEQGKHQGYPSLANEASSLTYPQELGERNTLADGASFTDPSQPLLPPPLLVHHTPLPGEIGNQFHQPTGASESSVRSFHSPPSTLALGEVRPPPVSTTPQPITSWTLASEPETKVAEASVVSPPQSLVYTTEAFNNGGAETLGNALTATPATGEATEVLPPMGIRLPASGSRSQSGTPSMERESERPDAEGGYENDQPTPLYSAPVTTTSYGALTQESPATSRPASRQAGSTPSTEMPSGNQTPSYMSGSGNESFVRPKPVANTGGVNGASTAVGFYASPNSTSTPITSPPQSASPFHVARGSQEAVGSEYGPPTMLPPSSQRMIPGSGFQGPPLLSVAPQQQPQPPQPQQQPQQQQQQQQRPSGSLTPVSEQRIVTGFAKNDPVLPPSLVTGASQPAAAHTTGGSGVMGPPPSVEAEPRTSLNRSPPSHRSETIGSENPRANVPSGTPATMLASGGGPSGGGINSADRSDERGSSGEQVSRDRDHVNKPHDSRSRMDRGKYL